MCVGLVPVAASCAKGYLVRFLEAKRGSLQSSASNALTCLSSRHHDTFFLLVSPRLSSSLLELSSFPRASEGRFGGEVERGLVYTTRETRYPPWWRVYRIDSTVLVNFRRKEKILKGSRFIILCFRKEDAQMEFLVKESEEEYLRDDK